MSEEAKPKKNKRNTWIIVTIVVLILLLFFSLIGIFAGIFVLTNDDSSLFSEDAIGVIRLDGVISGSGSDGIGPEEFSKNLKEAIDDESVKAIVIRVDSPGGTPAASQEMYEEVRRANKKKPVIASVADVAASGAYYAISPSKEIVASKASDIGSIGVFMAIPNMEELFKKLGIKWVFIKEGKYKTMGDPSKPLSKEEIKVLQEHTKIIYDQFIADVADARENFSESKVRKLATGRTWPGSQAKELGLIDQCGNYQDALDKAAKLGKIKGDDYEIIVYENSYNWFDLIDSGIKSITKALKSIESVPSASKNIR